MQGVLTIVGQRSLKFDDVDMLQLVAILPFPRAQNGSQGFDSKKCQFGKSENFEKLADVWKKNPKALIALDCEYEPVTNGIEVYDIYNATVMALTPVNQANKPAQQQK